MTKQEHQAQRDLVALSLLVRPAEGRHEGKGHEATGHDRHDLRH